ncbi:hypothetical protein V8F33_002105 [Rhypophila sp. PSN 637]
MYGHVQCFYVWLTLPAWFTSMQVITIAKSFRPFSCGRTRCSKHIGISSLRTQRPIASYKCAIRYASDRLRDLARNRKEQS